MRQVRAVLILSVIVSAGCRTGGKPRGDAGEPTIVGRAGLRLIGIQVWMDPETADYGAIFERQCRPHGVEARGAGEGPSK